MILLEEIQAERIAEDELVFQKNPFANCQETNRYW